MECVCFVRIAEQIANFALHNIKRSGFITEVECLLRGTHSPYTTKCMCTTQIHSVFKSLIKSTVCPKYAVAESGVVVPILQTGDFNAHNVT